MRASLILAAAHTAALLSACGPSSGDTESATDATDATTQPTTDPGPTGPGETTTTDATTADTADATTTEATTTDATTIDPTATSEPPQPVCDVEVVPGDHAGAFCPGGPCPITADVELRCADDNFTAPGVRVAAAPEAMWIATSSETDSMLFRVVGDGAERITLPARFARQTIHLATGPAGDLHVAAEVQNPLEATDSDVAYLSEAAGWAEQTARTGSAGEPLAGFQVLPDGLPHIFHFADGPDDYRELVPDGQGGWTSTPVALAPGGYGIPEFGRDAQGRLLAADMRGNDSYQLHVEVDGDARVIDGGFLASGSSAHFFLAPSAAPEPPDGPAFAALIQHSHDLQVAWPVDDQGIEAVWLPNLPPLDGDCPTGGIPDDAGECGPPCTDTDAGFERGAATLARTPDGLAWAVVVTTELDRTYEYVKDCQEEIGCFCVADVVADASVSTLRLLRVNLNGTSPIEVLKLPIPRLAVDQAWSEFGDSLIAAHAQAFGDSLAIGLSVRAEHGGPVSARAIRVELDTLSP